MNAENQFDWVEFYKELASKLLQYKASRADLVDKVKQIYGNHQYQHTHAGKG